MALYTILFGISIFMIAFVMAIIKRMFFHWKEDTITERMLMTTIDRPACSLIIYTEKCVLRRKIFTGGIYVYDVIGKDDLELNKELVPDIMPPDMFIDTPMTKEVAQENMKDSHLTDEVRNKNIESETSNNQPQINSEMDNEKIYEEVELKIKELQKKIKEKVEERHDKWELSEVETCNIEFKSDDRKENEDKTGGSEATNDNRETNDNFKDFKDKRANSVSTINETKLDVKKALVFKDDQNRHDTKEDQDPIVSEAHKLNND